MIRNCCVAILASISSLSGYSQCSEDATNKVLLVGDSWAFFMGVDQTINTVLERWGHSDARYLTNLTIAENGAETDDFLTAEKQDEIEARLIAEPSIKVVHLSIGGNDVLGDWNVEMTTQQTDSLEASVRARLVQVIDFILNVRPDVHVLWSGYMYPNFEEVIESFAPLQTLHPFYGTWEDMGFPSFEQINNVMINFSAGIEAYTDTMPRVHFVNSPGFLQYTFGQESNLGVAPGGTYDQFTAPLPNGFPTYPSPISSMRDYGLTRDCFHLSAGGYRDMIDLHTREFYHKFLMDDLYLLAGTGSENGSVSSTGTISNTLQLGLNGTEEFATALTFNTTVMDMQPVEKASIFLRRDSLTGANPIGSTLHVKAKHGVLGTTMNVEAVDYIAVADAEVDACRFGSNDGNGRWIRIDLPEEMLPFISQTDITQFVISSTATSQGSVYFTDGTDPELAPVLNIKYGEISTSIASTNTDTEQVLFPNPTNGMITVNAEHVQTLRVMDMLGRTVLFQKNNVSTLDLSSLPNGCYSVLVQSDPGNSVHRVVKQ